PRHQTFVSDHLARPSAPSFTLTRGERGFSRQHRHLFGFPKAAPSARVEPSRRATRGASTGTCFALLSECHPRRLHCALCSRRRSMQTLRRIAAVLTFPAVAYLGAACERETPTGAPPPPLMQMADAARTWTND